MDAKDSSTRSAGASWVCLSSSSGATFRSVYRALTPEARAGLRGFFVDRPCGALQVAREELADSGVASERIQEFPRKEFEARYLEFATREGLIGLPILLCGFFGILSANFLANCGGAVVNTHPSLLPAFPGLDEKVHRKAQEEATLSGFSVHLVNEKLDGGPIVFQHPVALDPHATFEQNRDRVRAAEQRYLPLVWSRILLKNLSADDRHLSTRELRVKHDFHYVSYQDRETLKE
jgi:phosphoribosylglycinamide formyltransferase-1